MALLKLIYLATQNIQKKWTQPLQNLGLTVFQLSIRFGDRLRLRLGQGLVELIFFCSYQTSIGILRKNITSQREQICSLNDESLSSIKILLLMKRAFRILILIILFFAVVVILAAKIEKPADGNDHYGFPLIFLKK